MTTLSKGWHKSKKKHCCDGHYWIEEWAYYYAKFSKKKRHVCKGIGEGEEYYREVNTYDGFGVFKCCKHCWDFAKKHKLEFNDNW